MSPRQIVNGGKLLCLEKSVIRIKFINSLNLSHAYVLLSEIISYRRRRNKKKASTSWLTWGLYRRNITTTLTV